MCADKKVPDIRFKGFSGEWEQRAFGDCFDNIPNNTLSRAELNYEYGIARNIHYGDVLIKFGETLDANNTSLPFITDENFVYKQKNAALRNGDIVIADAAEDSTVGKCTELFNIDNQVILSGLHTIAIRPMVPFASKYLGYYLNSSSYHDQLLPLMQGTKVLSISKSALQYTNINFPNKNEEQIKIGNTFQKLDSLINQHQQKHDKLNNIKKAMLEKMFPKQGETVPEIRFKGFSGKWETKKICSICNISTGKNNTQDKVSDGKYPFFVRSAVIERSNNFLFDEEAVLTVGDGVGTGKVYHYINGKYDLHQRVYRMFGFKDINAKYFYHYFSNHFYERVISMTAKTSVDSVRLEMIANMDILMPENNEQKKIARYLDRIDTLINQHQQQITKLNHIKQACLSKMFI